MNEHTEGGHGGRTLEAVPPPARHGGSEHEAPAPWHVVPRTVADTGLDISLLLGLLVKVAYLQRTATLAMLIEAMKLPPAVVNEVAAYAVRERMLEVAHRGASDLDVRFRLTDNGYARAGEFTARCSYAGSAPVTLDAYLEAIQLHSIQLASVSKADVAAAFGDLILPPRLLDDVGVALNTGRALMLYGPAGSGKTFLAQRLGVLMPGAVPVPHAITVAGEIIQVFDPLVHKPFEDGNAQMARRSLDRRWTICHRPTVLCGGELTLAALELRHDTTSGFYHAPPQMKANNGILIIDDLGRQQMRVDELLNRWIVPLDRGVDMFSLHNGVRFSAPFDVWPVFSSNLEPRDLGDAAFLRRLGSKLMIGPLTVEDYREVFMRAARELGLHASDAVFTYLLDGLHCPAGTPLLACIPRDLLRLVASTVQYHGSAPQVSEEGLHRAWQSYFGTDEAIGAPPPPAADTEWRPSRQAKI